MAQLLIVYASRYGQTAKIADRLAARLEQHGHSVTVASAKRVPSTLSPERYAGVIVGGPVYNHRFPSYLGAWLRRWRPALRGKLEGFFGVSGAAADPGEGHVASEIILQRFIDRLGMQPKAVSCFAGSILYTRYDPLTRRLLQWVVGRSGGDTDTSRDFEYTDWEAVERFADRIGAAQSAEHRTEIPRPEEEPLSKPKH